MQKPATTAIFTLIVLIGLGSGCRSMTGRSLGTNIDDKLTNAQVKARLSATEVRNLTWVDVDTKSGVVYLSGNVRADGDRQQAEDLARRSAGVRQVVNNLQVVGATAAATEPGRPATTR